MTIPARKFPARLLGLLRPRLGRFSLPALFVLLAALAAGCSSGSYPLDFFYEMHYQQSYSSHEPPRLSLPAGAVPITGKEIPLESLTVEQISQLPNPFLGDDGTRAGIPEGQVLFETNCVICHGPMGEGDGEVLNVMRDDYGYTVKLDPNLTGLAGLGEGRLFGIISDRSLVFPGVEGWVMPQFRKLLSTDERWSLVNYIRILEVPTTCPEELTGAELGDCLVVNYGCAVCHSLDGSDATGPTWKGLYGTEETLKDGATVVVGDSYLEESILDPDAKIVAGFPAGLMPKTFGGRLSGDEIQAIIAYIKTLE